MKNQLAILALPFSVFVTTVPLGGSAEKISVDNGLASYCRSPVASDAAVELYVYDVAAAELHKHYLPGTICPQYDGVCLLRFPLAWSVKDGKLGIVFPSVQGDVMGKITTHLWRSPNLSEVEKLKKVCTDVTGRQEID